MLSRDLTKQIIYYLLNDENVLDKTLSGIEKYTLESSQKKNLLDRWNKSNFSDYSVYNDKDYQWDLVNCYLAVSRESILRSVKYLKDNVNNYSELSVFDDYNGNGLTTLLLSSLGFNDISYYNSVDFQIEALNNICEKYSLNKPKLDINRSNQYDVFIGLECIEHFKKPSDYLDSIMHMVKDGGYLFLTFNGFQWTPEFSIGHFYEYETVEGDLVNGTKIRKLLMKQLNDNGFKLVKKACWNANPQLFIKSIK